VSASDAEGRRFESCWGHQRPDSALRTSKPVSSKAQILFVPSPKAREGGTAPGCYFYLVKNNYLIIAGWAVVLSTMSGCAPFLSSPVTSDSAATPIGQRDETLSSAKARIASESPTPYFSRPGGTSSPNSVSRTLVIWKDYDSGLQTSIDEATDSTDCNGITTYFGMAAATEDSVKARTGHSNEALVAYLNEALALAACH
jgi:hypothetical protein